MKARIITLGCKVNQYDSEAFFKSLKSEGFELAGKGEEADLYIINTCTVTAEADRKSRQTISRIRREHKGAKIVVAGCMAQRDKDTAMELGADIVVGTNNRKNIIKSIKEASNNIENILEVDDFEEMSALPMERTRGLIKVQEGCNNFCSYCIIPYVRGKSRSRRLESIVNEAKMLRDLGIKEAVITGIHIDSYNRDGKRLADVIEAVADTGIARVRLGSLHPWGINKEEIKRISKLPNLMEQFHLSLQSGSDETLMRMRRKYTALEYKEYTDCLKTYFDMPAITTDVITGFPGESEEEFLKTLDFIKEIGFARVHVFPYSEREGTYAASLEGKVPKNVRALRAAKAISVAKSVSEEFIKGLTGKREQVLIEQGGKGYLRRYILTHINGQENEIIPVVIKGAKDGEALTDRI
ncbi:MAG: tRNA (N(6)-L-threonylcarbamoyladenosine(37)-C(2))-methylthiotransferase MtaB [Eubacteriales bacterium]